MKNILTITCLMTAGMTLAQAYYVLNLCNFEEDALTALNFVDGTGNTLTAGSVSIGYFDEEPAKDPGSIVGNFKVFSDWTWNTASNPDTGTFASVNQFAVSGSGDGEGDCAEKTLYVFVGNGDSVESSQEFALFSFVYGNSKLTFGAIDDMEGIAELYFGDNTILSENGYLTWELFLGVADGTNISLVAIPEPSAFGLLAGLGALALLGARRRRK